MKNSIIVCCCALVVTLTGSCTKEPLNNLSEAEGRIYVTNRDESVSFGSYSTFSIADSAAVIHDNQLVERARTAVDAAYIEAVKAEMQQRGYTLVARDQDPDIAVNVNRIFNTSVGTFSYADYYGYYGGYWDPYYWGYPGYDYMFPGAVGFYEVTEGAWSIDMLDLKNADATSNIRGIWNGLIRGPGIFNAENAASGVNMLFDQSTYLETN